MKQEISGPLADLAYLPLCACVSVRSHFCSVSDFMDSTSSRKLRKSGTLWSQFNNRFTERMGRILAY